VSNPTGSGFANADTITILNPTGEIYTFAINFAGDSTALIGPANGSLSFTATAANGLVFLDASGNFDKTVGTASVTTTLSNLSGSGQLVTTGSGVGPTLFNSNTTATSGLISWAAASGSVSQSLSLAFNLQNQASVPGPLPLLGAGMAFGFSRKLRKRIKYRP
jgi:hypothetical protein